MIEKSTDSHFRALVSNSTSGIDFADHIPQALRDIVKAVNDRGQTCKAAKTSDFYVTPWEYRTQCINSTISHGGNLETDLTSVERRDIMLQGRHGKNQSDYFNLVFGLLYSNLNTKVARRLVDSSKLPDRIGPDEETRITHHWLLKDGHHRKFINMSFPPTMLTLNGRRKTMLSLVQRIKSNRLTKPG